jgi:hypothetical protein
MPVRLHHIVVDAHDLPGLARFWDPGAWLDLTSSAQDRDLGLEPLKRHRVAAASDGPSILASGPIIQRRWSPPGRAAPTWVA